MGDVYKRQVPGIALAEVVCLILGAHLVGARPCMLEHPAHVVHAVSYTHLITDVMLMGTTA